MAHPAALPIYPYELAIQLKASENPIVQAHFLRGLLWCYGFHHEEGMRCFEAALDIEADCPLALWGVAYSIAPFYNRPWNWFTPKQQQSVAARGFTALQSAAAKAKQRNHNALNVALIESLQLRYPQQQAPSTDAHERYLHAYSDALVTLAADYPNHPDVLSLAAEGLMNLTPWQLWDLHTGRPAQNAHTLDALQLLETGLKTMHLNKTVHAGLLHYHVHALEMSPAPEMALASANIIRTTPSPCGHLTHMATHIDIQVGAYADAIETNTRAIVADAAVATRTNEFYLISRLHNCHLKLYAAMMAGRLKDALAAQAAINTLVCPEEVCQSDRYLGISIEGFFASQQHIRIRFGQWQELIEQAPPEDSDNYLLTTALHYYATSIAHAALGNIQQSLQATEQFKKARKRIPDWHIVNNNKTQDTLEIAAHMQLGERLYREAKYDAAFDALRTAVQLSDQLNYCEPWAWMHPPRHALGALLLEQDYVVEARQVFEADLGLGEPCTAQSNLPNANVPRSLQHPGNVWALHGLHECLERTNDLQAHPLIEEQLAKAQKFADVRINASCCCRH